MSEQTVCYCSTYPFPHRMFGGECEGLNPDMECPHGVRVYDGDICLICERETWIDDVYHALKDDGCYDKR